MLKKLAFKYWPVVLLFICIVTVLFMSHYAENRKAINQNSARQGSPTPSISPNDASKRAYKEDKSEHPPDWIDTFTWPEGVTAWALFLTLLVIAWQSTETRSAANAADRQSEIASDTARRQLRAYLCIGDSLVKFTDDGFLEGQLYLKNVGQTPAYKVRCWNNSMIREYPLIEKTLTPPPDFRMASGIIPPQSHHVIVANKITAPDLIMQAIEIGKAAYYVYGEATYEDIFGDSHTLEYRLICGGSVKPRTKLDTNGVKIGFMHMDIEGNEERNQKTCRDQHHNPN